MCVLAKRACGCVRMPPPASTSILFYRIGRAPSACWHAEGARPLTIAEARGTRHDPPEHKGDS